MSCRSSPRRPAQPGCCHVGDELPELPALSPSSLIWAYVPYDEDVIAGRPPADVIAAASSRQRSPPTTQQMRLPPHSRSPGRIKRCWA